MSNVLIRCMKMVLSIFLLQLSLSASAQATRTWVSGVGDDANPCSRTAPCKTFAGAISKTAAGGEINALDPGGFGAVTITKSIVIEGRGVMASVLSAGTNGVIVNAGANDVVVIRGVNINGAGSGLNGIRFLAGKSLHVEDCVIENVTQKGIDAQPTTAGSLLLIRDTVIRNAADPTNGGGIFAKPGSGVSMAVALDNVRMDRNKFGLRIEDNVKATVRNSVASDSDPGNGFIAFSAASPTELYLQNSIASGNTLAGVKAYGAAARIHLSSVGIFNNAQGLAVTDGGQIVSFGNNSNAGNVAPGAPTSNVAQQ